MEQALNRIANLLEKDSYIPQQAVQIAKLELALNCISMKAWAKDLSEDQVEELQTIISQIKELI